MADTFYQKPSQGRPECQALEKNYINCLIQKGLKDKLPGNMCHLESILWYHVECPDYIKKWDQPEHQKHLKRQIFNFLAMPYVNYRYHQLEAKKIKQIPKDLQKKEKYIEYPEEIADIPLSRQQKVFQNKDSYSKFVEGVEFEKDPSEE